MANVRKIEPEKPGATGESTIDSLETVKEILFGNEVNELFERQEKLAKEIDARLEKITQRLHEKCDIIEEFVKKMSQSLSSQLQHEGSTRAKEDESIRELILDSLKRNSKELYAYMDDQGKRLEGSLVDMANAKLDRTMLAKMFNDTAAKLVEHRE